MNRTTCKSKQIYLIFFIGVLLTACTHNKKVDVSNISVDVTIERFDRDLDAMRTKPMAQQAAFLKPGMAFFTRILSGLLYPQAVLMIQLILKYFEIKFSITCKMAGTPTWI